jgi:putative ubiquitin-RnfH superfamily antitoxin RatB of RatAB toxin-antitoxin module|tara:strand:+ start:1456 stop:1767 length:312 start_codon:yes stop_codon:yes gene_type:complete
MSAKDKAKYKDFIEVIYISKENSITQEFFNYLNGMTVQELIFLIKKNKRFNFLDLDNLNVGIFGEIIKDFDVKLKNFDRIEIYDKFNYSTNDKRKKNIKNKNI